jgi:hypothetical protein
MAMQLERGRAPIYSPLWTERRKIHNRLGDPEHRKFVNLLLQDPFPNNIPIFDTADNELQLTGGVLGPLQSLENRIMLAEDWWWFGTTASFTAGSATSSPFSFQLFHTINYGEENEAGFKHQQKAVSEGNCFGTGQRPFYLKVPKLYRKNTELLCKVSNDQNANNGIQIVLLGYLGEPVGGLT